MNKRITKGTIFAVLAASIYAINFPISKLLLGTIEPTMMAAFLYLGAGIGMSILSLFADKSKGANNLQKSDFPYIIGMIVLDIIAAIAMMLGISIGSSANASLLGNFEIVATSMIAFLVFHEMISSRLWFGIVFICISCIVLSFEGQDSLRFSLGSVLVLLATLCWGLENNFCKTISSKNTYQIVVLKGLFVGLGSLVIAFVVGESLPDLLTAIESMILGFVSYGFSVFLYVRSQSVLGAAKTSAYYASAPLIGSFLSFVILHEVLSVRYVVALIIMLFGAGFVVKDSLDQAELE